MSFKLIFKIRFEVSVHRQWNFPEHFHEERLIIYHKKMNIPGHENIFQPLYSYFIDSV